MPGRITIGGMPESIIFFNSVNEEWITLHDSPCRSARSIPSMIILPLKSEYFLADSIASAMGNSTFQYLDTTLIGNGRQMFSSSTRGKSN